nr:MAG TPA: hypothetical protein [Caudoviricetes sp.]
MDYISTQLVNKLFKNLLSNLKPIMVKLFLGVLRA